MAALVRHNGKAAYPQLSAVEIRTRVDARETGGLYEALGRVKRQKTPRTARLLPAGCSKVAPKPLEEAGDVALKPGRRRPHAVVRKGADLVHQLVVVWRGYGVAPDEAWGEMRQRAERLGISEKPPKPKIAGAPAAAGQAEGRAG